MKIKLRSIFTVVLFIAGLIHAQNFVNVYSDKPGLDNVVEKIDFLDDNTREVINSFDVEEHNPFKYLDTYMTKH